MRMTISLIEVNGVVPNDLIGEQEFNTADVATFLVAPWTDSETPFLKIPDGFHIIDFRFFAADSSIVVHVGRGKLVSPEFVKDLENTRDLCQSLMNSQSSIPMNCTPSSKSLEENSPTKKPNCF